MYDSQAEVEGEDEDNPYVREFARLSHRVAAASSTGFWMLDPGADSWYAERVSCVRRYAFGIPNRAALTTIARYAPIIELGAGTGYWTYLLRRRGVDCLAFDLAPPDRVEQNPNRFRPLTWTKVQPGGVEQLAGHERRALLLCWPSLADPFADQALQAYAGNTLLYVGEGAGGHTADDSFFTRLQRDWREVETIAIPNWPGTADRLVVYSNQQSAVSYQPLAVSR